MTELTDEWSITGRGNVLEYDKDRHIDHFHYFCQKETIQFIARKLKQSR